MASIQLPDLLSLVRPFGLRTNRWCRDATAASEKWFLGLDGLTETERTMLPSMKVGLLAALCLPGWDAPQLRLMTDFLSLVVCSNRRVLYGASCPWPAAVDDVNAPAPVVGSADQRSGMDLLSDHVLFNHIIPRIGRLASCASVNWRAQFTRSVHVYRSAQLHVFEGRSRGWMPGLEEYREQRRNMSGSDMVFDMLELLEGLRMPPLLRDSHKEKLENLRQLTADIISWSLDIYSYNIDQSRQNNYSLIPVLMKSNGLSVQGAVNFANTRVKEALASFCSIENSFVESCPVSLPDRSLSSSIPPFSWIFTAYNNVPKTTPSSALSSINRSEELHDEETLAEIQAYIQGLKDCVAGVINWAYETELYFGTKGEEVRAFGWLFLDTIAPSDGA